MSYNAYVCSVCGTVCGQDSRMGSLDVYLVCKCAENTVWIPDRCGGYSMPVNGAQPILATEFASKRSR